MKLADLATGSDWIAWIVFVIFAALSITLLSGHGSWFISGYNTATKEEKENMMKRSYAEQWELNVYYSNSCINYGLLENILPAFLYILHWELF